SPNASAKPCSTTPAKPPSKSTRASSTTITVPWPPRRRRGNNLALGGSVALNPSYRHSERSEESTGDRNQARLYGFLANTLGMTGLAFACCLPNRELGALTWQKGMG